LPARRLSARVAVTEKRPTKDLHARSLV
jgi:hypothetical protein